MELGISRSGVSLLLTLISAVAALGQSNWVRQSPFPTDRSARAVFAFSPDRAFFVGENKLMMQTQDAGASWNVHQLLDWGVEPHYAVHFMSPTTGLITGNNEALRTTDGGATWASVQFFAGSWSYLDFLDANVGFAGANGACAATTDGGLTWSLRSGYPDCPVMFGMDFRDANVGLVGGVIAGSGDYGIFKTSDGGRTWSKKADGSANDVVWMSSTRAIADFATTIRETLDSGETWHTVFTGLTSGLVSMTRAGTANLVLGVSVKGDVWRSTDGGRFWQQTFDGPGALPDTWEISFADELHGWIVGPGGFYYFSEDGGVTWRQKNNGCTAQIFDIQMLNADYGLAVGHDGYVFRTTNGGEFWEIQKLEVTGQIFGRDEDLVAVDVVDADFAVVAGPGGTIFKTMDGGLNWTSIGYPTLSGEFWIYDVDFIDHNLGYVYGVNAPDDTKFLFRTRNGGLTWEWVNMGLIGGGTTAQFVDADYGWLTADNNFGWRTTNGGVSWTSFNMPVYFTSPEVSKVRFLDRNNGWVVGWDGYVGKTTDGGLTWTLVDLGTITDHLFDVVPVSSNEIWICGREDWSQKGLIYRSANGGQAWTRQVVTDWFYYPYRMSVLPTGDSWFAGYAGTIYKKASDSSFVEPTSYILQPGIWVSGNLIDLVQSDDRYIVADPQYSISRTQDPIMLQVQGISPTANPTSIEFVCESRATSAGVQLKIEMWNFSQSRWETVHTSTASQSDSTLTISAPLPTSRFVDPTTRLMRARMGLRPLPTASRSWRAFVDRMIWRVTQ